MVNGPKLPYLPHFNHRTYIGINTMYIIHLSVKISDYHVRILVKLCAFCLVGNISLQNHLFESFEYKVNKFGIKIICMKNEIRK